jgi:hypothetical protein
MSDEIKEETVVDLKIAKAILELKDVMRDGFVDLAKELDSHTDKKIETHIITCSKTSFISSIKDWRTIAAVIFAIIWLLTSVVSNFNGDKELKDKLDKFDKILQQIAGPQTKLDGKLNIH